MTESNSLLGGLMFAVDVAEFVQERGSVTYAEVRWRFPLWSDPQVDIAIRLLVKAELVTVIAGRLLWRGDVRLVRETLQ